MRVRNSGQKSWIRHIPSRKGCQCSGTWRLWRSIRERSLAASLSASGCAIGTFRREGTHDSGTLSAGETRPYCVQIESFNIYSTVEVDLFVKYRLKVGCRPSRRRLPYADTDTKHVRVGPEKRGLVECECSRADGLEEVVRSGLSVGHGGQPGPDLQLEQRIDAPVHRVDQADRLSRAQIKRYSRVYTRISEYKVSAL